MSDRLRAARYAGQAAPAVAFGGILLATVLAPWFSWPGDALSDLGVAATSSVALLFNGALVAGGLLALPYAGALWADAGADTDANGGTGTTVDRLAARTVAVLFGLSAVLMALVGVFPIPAELAVAGTVVEPHGPVAVGFYLGLTATLAVDGLRRLRERAGQASLALAVVHVGYWLVWAAGVRPGPGLAIPEAVGAAALTVWVWALSPSRPRRTAQ